MGSVDRVGSISGLEAFESVMPFGGDLCACGDLDNSGGYWLVVGVNSSIANHIVGSDVGDGLVVVHE